ncbi:hypothetical protein L6452_22653 [Arctium lappa]|uniref:Uncharacterized protein n=1 Tax=Arctium lappa TaxID=4217 RepID=A0ACB9AZS9_ARCLA|nr:hypothetical protein L6452_22653 [Arctium lappa]
MQMKNIDVEAYFKYAHVIKRIHRILAQIRVHPHSSPSSDQSSTWLAQVTYSISHRTILIAFGKKNSWR